MKNPFLSIQKKWNNYLDRLAKVNQDLYGNKRLDCCDVNQSKKQKHEQGGA